MSKARYFRHHAIGQLTPCDSILYRNLDDSEFVFEKTRGRSRYIGIPRITVGVLSVGIIAEYQQLYQQRNCKSVDFIAICTIELRLALIKRQLLVKSRHHYYIYQRTRSQTICAILKFSSWEITICFLRKRLYNAY